MILSSILLQAGAQAAASSTSGWGAFLPLILIFVVFYFFMIRPQNKKQKEIQNARASLKQGDKVVTSGGIYGKIREIKDDSFIIEISENVKVQVEKNSVFSAEKSAKSAETKK